MDELNSSVVEQEVAAPAQEEETVADNTPDTEEPTAEPETQEERPLSENNRWAISRRRAEEEDRLGFFSPTGKCSSDSTGPGDQDRLGCSR